MIICIHDELVHLSEIKNCDSEKNKRLLSSKCTPAVKWFEVNVRFLLSSHKKQ